MIGVFIGVKSNSKGVCFLNFFYLSLHSRVMATFVIFGNLIGSYRGAPIGPYGHDRGVIRVKLNLKGGLVSKIF